MIPEITDPSIHVALLVFRVLIGTTIAIHGYGKFCGENGIKGTANWFNSVGMKPGMFHARLAAIAEITLGNLISMGFVSSFALAGLVALMTVACLVAHRRSGFLIIKDGWEYTAILASIGVLLAMLGPGRYSIDYALGIYDLFDGWYGLLISAGGGVLAAMLMLGMFYVDPQGDAAKNEEKALIRRLLGRGGKSSP